VSGDENGSSSSGAFMSFTGLTGSSLLTGSSRLTGSSVAAGVSQAEDVPSFRFHAPLTSAADNPQKR